MMVPRANSKSLLAAGLLVLVVVLAGVLHTYLCAQDSENRRKPELGLFSTLPIFWGETAQLSDLIAQDREAHWARPVLERVYRLTPLDILSTEAGAGLDGDRNDDRSGRLAYLMMAQPRALSAAENVALDGWVRDGGRLLLFADPMLTAHSAFAIGDKRRPHDVVLLSPILAHWGLRLEFDDTQPAEERIVAILGAQVPVDLPGRLVHASDGEASGVVCQIVAGGLAAMCKIGGGQALIIADAAVLDGHAAEIASRQLALESLASQAFMTQ